MTVGIQGLVLGFARNFLIVAAFCVGAQPGLLRAADEDQPKPQALTNPDEINERLMSKRVSAKFDQVPLTDAVDYVANIADVNTFIDAKSLEANGIDPNSQVTLKLRNPVSAAQALRLLLRAVSPALNFNVDEEVVIIAASSDSAQPPQPPAPPELDTRVYDVTDLLTGAGAGGALVGLLTQSVTPDAWKSEAGAQRMTLLGHRLVISAPTEAQDQVNELLTKVRHATPNGVPREKSEETEKKEKN